jgi:hypothetical protein
VSDVRSGSLLNSCTMLVRFVRAIFRRVSEPATPTTSAKPTSQHTRNNKKSNHYQMPEIHAPKNIYREL